MSKLLVRFVVPGNPVANPRPKATTKGQVYSPKSKKLTPKQQAEHGGRKWVTHPIVTYKAAIQDAFKKVKNYAGKLNTPLRVDCLFVFERPQRLMRKSSPLGMILHGSKPDVDNLEKAVYDALNDVAWTDDALVSSNNTRKRYAKKLANEGYTEVSIYEDMVGESS